MNNISAQIDLRSLEGLLQNITYAKIEREDVENFINDFIKMFRLAQMSIEYLIYSQNYLEILTQSLDMQYKTEFLQNQ